MVVDHTALVVLRKRALLLDQHLGGGKPPALLGAGVGEMITEIGPVLDPVDGQLQVRDVVAEQRVVADFIAQVKVVDDAWPGRTGRGRDDDDARQQEDGRQKADGRGQFSAPVQNDLRLSSMSVRRSAGRAKLRDVETGAGPAGPAEQSVNVLRRRPPLPQEAQKLIFLGA